MALTGNMAMLSNIAAGKANGGLYSIKLISKVNNNPASPNKPKVVPVSSFKTPFIIWMGNSASQGTRPSKAIKANAMMRLTGHFVDGFTGIGLCMSEGKIGNLPGLYNDKKSSTATSLRIIIDLSRAPFEKKSVHLICSVNFII